jgi:hypothetical protein
VNGGVNYLQDPLHIPRQVVVPEADDPIAFPFEPLCPDVIASLDGNISMLRAVDFDDETRGHASKVRDVRADRDLATEMTPERGQTSKMAP